MQNKKEQRAKLKHSRLTGQHNQCPSCGELFNSNAAFDKHRKPIGWCVGIKPEVSRLLDRFPRRCLSTEEMLAIDMQVNIQGFWVTAAMPEDALQEKIES